MRQLVLLAVASATGCVIKPITEIGLTGTVFDNEQTLAFANLQDVRPMIETFPLEQAQAAYDRMMRADVSYPLLVIIEDGCLSVADGLNRMYKAINVLGMTHIDVYLVPKEDIIGLTL